MSSKLLKGWGRILPDFYFIAAYISVNLDRPSAVADESQLSCALQPSTKNVYLCLKFEKRLAFDIHTTQNLIMYPKVTGFLMLNFDHSQVRDPPPP